MRFFPVIPLAVTLAMAPLPTSAPADAGALADATRALHEAVLAGKADALLQARARLQALSAADPGSAALHYWVAVATWRAVPLMPEAQRKQAALLTQDGLAQCDAALKLDPKLAEALALKGGLQGIAIRFDPASMMTLGPQSEANIARAIGMAPGNPRIRLLQGIGTLNKPAMFGGGAVPAAEIFGQALALFAADTAADSTAPRWGRDDACLWAGRAAMEMRKFAAARDFFAAALEVSPGHAWVRHALLPAAEDSLARAKDKP
jgi:tetratricopeptide (TPR) repeat protein